MFDERTLPQRLADLLDTYVDEASVLARALIDLKRAAGLAAYGERYPASGAGAVSEE